LTTKLTSVIWKVIVSDFPLPIQGIAESMSDLAVLYPESVKTFLGWFRAFSRL
jgi:hypothetical protein